MNIIGIGESMIEDLFRTGIVRSIPDFFTIANRHDEFCSIEGFGEKTWKKICKQFKHLEATQSQILAAVGIPGIGPKNSKRILGIYHVSDLLEMVEKEGSFVQDVMDAGITPNIAERLLKGIKENKKTLKFLMKNVKIKKEVKNEHGIIVFTGFRNARFKTHLEDLGYTVADSMSGSVNLVIAENPDGKTSKLEKARKLGIPIIGVSNAFEKFGFKM
jgi:NAD-dependent DNA ligase